MDDGKTRDGSGRCGCGPPTRGFLLCQHLVDFGVVFPSQTPEYRRARWAEKRDEVNAARRLRYANDELYRASVRAYNSEHRDAGREAQRRHTSLVQAAKTKLGRCLTCGYNRHVGALQWHHWDPSTKEREPSTLRSSADRNALPELRKCVLLCSNCHWEVTHGRRDIPAELHFRCVQWLELFTLERARARGEV